MEVRVQESGTIVQVDKLPVIEAIPTQMEQLFQNLISNAIKFKQPEKAPLINISAQFIKADELNNSPTDVIFNTANGSAYQWRKEPLIKITI